MEVALVVIGAALALMGGVAGDLWRDERAARRGAALVASELASHLIRWSWWRGDVERMSMVTAKSEGRPWPPPEKPSPFDRLPVAQLAERYGVPMPEMETSAFQEHRAPFIGLLTSDQEAALFVYYLLVNPRARAGGESYDGIIHALDAAHVAALTIRARSLPALAWRRLRDLGEDRPTIS